MIGRGKLVRIDVDLPTPHCWSFPLLPKQTAYGGMGFARDSEWLSLRDEDFMEKFTVLYEAHVDFGSTGKAFLKGMKRERDKDMLWRQKLKEKMSQNSQENSNKKERSLSLQSEPGDSVMKTTNFKKAATAKQRVKERRAKLLTDQRKEISPSKLFASLV
mmetsp:Transcript_34140/g.106938  ORF Transcript_34140/g.106938 Transcript_34140/m.106938 type:complete len:160 (-) Transcript_34140:209-688(-)